MFIILKAKSAERSYSFSTAIRAPKSISITPTLITKIQSVEIMPFFLSISGFSTVEWGGMIKIREKRI
jgi:hypothetical protein